MLGKDNQTYIRSKTDQSRRLAKELIQREWIYLQLKKLVGSVIPGCGRGFHYKLHDEIGELLVKG
jgi:hypothetical protein